MRQSHGLRSGEMSSVLKSFCRVLGSTDCELMHASRSQTYGNEALAMPYVGASISTARVRNVSVTICFSSNSDVVGTRILPDEGEWTALALLWGLDTAAVGNGGLAVVASNRGSDIGCASFKRAAELKTRHCIAEQAIVSICDQSCIVRKSRSIFSACHFTRVCKVTLQLVHLPTPTRDLYCCLPDDLPQCTAMSSKRELWFWCLSVGAFMTLNLYGKQTRRMGDFPSTDMRSLIQSLELLPSSMNQLFSQGNACFGTERKHMASYTQPPTRYSAISLLSLAGYVGTSPLNCLHNALGQCYFP